MPTGFFVTIESSRIVNSAGNSERFAGENGSRIRKFAKAFRLHSGFPAVCRGPFSNVFFFTSWLRELAVRIRSLQRIRRELQPVQYSRESLCYWFFSLYRDPPIFSLFKSQYRTLELNRRAVRMENPRFIKPSEATSREIMQAKVQLAHVKERRGSVI